MFEKEIEYFRAVNKMHQDLVAKKEKLVQNFFAEGNKIKGMELEKNIADKLIKIKNAVEEGYKLLLEKEKSFGIAPENSVKLLFEQTAPDYNEKEFIEEAKKAYEKFKTGAGLVKSVVLNNNRAMHEVMAVAYANICDICNRSEQLCQAYVSEQDLKDRIIAKRCAAYSKEANAIDDQIQLVVVCEREELNSFERDLNNALDEMSRLAPIPEEPKMPSEFSANTFVLGISKCNDYTVLDLPMYDKSYKIPRISGAAACSLTFGSKENIVITYSKEKANEQGVWDIIKCLTMRFLLSYPSKYKRVAAMHNMSAGSGFLEVMSAVRRCCADDILLFCDNINKGFDSTYNEIEHTLDSISNIIDERRQIVYNSGSTNIIEYNEKNVDNAQPIMLVFVKDVEASRHYMSDKLLNIAMAGPNVGVHMVLLTDNFEELRIAGRENELSTFRKFEYSQGFLLEVGKNNQIDCCAKKERLTPSYFEKIKKLADGDSQAIDFLEFQKENHRSREKDYRDTITFPIGKNGATPVYVSLDSQSPAAHAMVEGMTGTGKSSFVKSYILSAAYNYSPEELEIWIFDFMKGAPDYQVFSKLNHVKYMSLDSNKMDALDLFNYINGELQKRGVIENSSNPRVLIVIDEYSRVNGACKAKLVEMATQVRKLGASLLFSSQDAPFEDVTNNVAHRFEMYEEKAYSLIKSLNKDNEKEYGLALKSRMVVYEAAGRKPVSVKFAYAGGDEQIEQTVEYINNMYAGKKKNETVVLGQEKRFTRADKVLSPDKEFKNGAVNIELGRNKISSSPVVYSVTPKSRRLYVIGERQRAISVEQLVAEAFAAVPFEETLIYYLNFSYDREACSAISDNPRVKYNRELKELQGLIEELYKIYRDRRSKGKIIEAPIEVILHCADRASKIIEDISSGEYSSSDSSYEKKEVTFEGIMLKQQSKMGRENYYSYSTDMQPDVKEMLKELLSAWSELNINFLIHVENVAEISKNSFLPKEEDDFKDCIIIPEIPKKAGKEMYKDLMKICASINQGKLAEEYKEIQDGLENQEEREKEIPNFKNFILIDNNSPTTYVPYID